MPDKMWEIMWECDMVVSAGGLILYELAVCGLPTAAFLYADNQFLYIKALEWEGLLRYIGHYDDFDKKGMVTYIKYLMGHPDIRERISKRQRSLVEEKGFERIEEKIGQIHRKKTVGLRGKDAF